MQLALPPSLQLTSAIRGAFSSDEYRVAASNVTLRSKRDDADLTSIVGTVGRTLSRDDRSLDALKALVDSRFSASEIQTLGAVTVDATESDEYAVAFLRTIAWSSRSQSTQDAIRAFTALAKVADRDDQALQALRGYFIVVR